MKPIGLALLTLALSMLLGLAGGAATVLDRDADLRLRDLNQQLYPDTVQQIDWICDGVADCVALR